jgi:excisionase family DNA binding protein
MENLLTFDQLPVAVSNLAAKLDKIEQLLIESSKHTSDQPDRFLNIQQAAELLTLSVPTIYSKVSKNELPVMKRGKRLYFSFDELMNYLKDGRKKTNSEIIAEASNYLKK